MQIKLNRAEFEEAIKGFIVEKLGDSFDLNLTIDDLRIQNLHFNMDFSGNPDEVVVDLVD